MLWAGRVLSALPVLLLVMSAVGKLRGDPKTLEMLTQHAGYPANVLTPLGVVELTSAVLYAIPQTAVLGAILLTGYMGGAIATHVRLGEGFVVQAILPMVLWAGLFLRDARLRALLPVVKKA